MNESTLENAIKRVLGAGLHAKIIFFRLINKANNFCAKNEMIKTISFMKQNSLTFKWMF